MTYIELKALKARRGYALAKTRLLEDFRTAQFAVNHAAIFCIKLDNNAVDPEKIAELEEKRILMNSIEKQILHVCIS